MSGTQFLLYESASGFALLEVTSQDEIGQGVDAVQQAVTDIARFGKAVKLAAFKPFTSAATALEQINAVSESQVRLAACRHACAPRRAWGPGEAPERRGSILGGRWTGACAAGWGVGAGRR